MSLRPDTRTAIVEAAFVRFAQDASASMAQIAQDAGVGRATLHRHFPAREDLLRDMALQAIRELDGAINAATQGADTYLDALKSALAASVPLAARQLFLAQSGIEQDPDIDAAYRASVAELITAIDGARTEGTLITDMPTSWIADVYSALIYVAWQSVEKKDATPRQAADLAWRSFINGISKGAQ